MTAATQSTGPSNDAIADVTPSLAGVAPAAPAIGTDAGETDRLGRLRSEASKLADQVSERARSAAESGKTRATETLGSAAQFVHDNAAKLGEQTTPKVAEYAHQAADALDGFSQTLRTKSIDDLVGDVRNFVKRSPAVAIGAAVAIGFVLTRFARSSAPAAGTGGYRGIQPRSRSGKTAA